MSRSYCCRRFAVCGRCAVQRDRIFGAAAYYITLGWLIFVLGPSKRPVANCAACRNAEPNHNPAACGHVFCHGFYSASADLDRFATQLDATPNGMIAIRTGAESGLVGIDVDPAHGGVIMPSMPRTLSVVTGSEPAGTHAYYNHPGVHVPNSQGLLGPGLDVRGDGGYLVAPPSIHPKTGRAYAWGPAHQIVEMPSPLVEACRPKLTVASSTGAPASTSAGRDITDPDALLAAHLRALAVAPEGRRRSTLYGISRGVARMVTAGAITKADAMRVLTDAGLAAGQSVRETDRAIVGGFNDEGVAA
jgi:bifunctional DNA primase/polymerase-like protein